MPFNRILNGFTIPAHTRNVHSDGQNLNASSMMSQSFNEETGIAMRKMIALLSALCVAAILAGCGQSQSAQPVDFDKNDVTFTGANSVTFQKAYDITQSDIVRKILIDEHITDAEFDQVREMYSNCLEEKGYEVEFEGNAGARSEHAPVGVSGEQALKDAKQCETRTALPYIEILHSVEGYASDEDTVTPLVDCLKRHGIADETMTAEDYKRIVTDPDLDDEYFGKYFNEQRSDYDAEKSPAYWACNANPNA